MPFIGTQPAESALTTAHLNDDIVTSAKIVDGTIAAGDIASSAVTTAKINADAITGAKIADDALDSEHYTDGSIDTAHLGDLQVTTAKIAADAITGAKVADDALDSEHYTDGSIDTAHLAADAITGAKIADDALDSEHYTDGSIDAAHIASNAVTTAKINADAVTGAKIADDALDSEHYTDGSIDTAHIAANAIDGTLTKDALIADYSDVTITASDLIMYGDATDSNNTKRDTVQGILDLAGGADIVKISTTTISSGVSEVDFTSLDNSTYRIHIFYLVDIMNSAQAYMHMQMISSSSTVLTSGYRWARKGLNNSSTSSTGVSVQNYAHGADGEFELSYSTWGSADNSFNAVVHVFNPGEAIETKVTWSSVNGLYADSTIDVIHGGGFTQGNATNHTGVRFKSSSGDLDDGFILHYGVKA